MLRPTRWERERGKFRGSEWVIRIKNALNARVAEESFGFSVRELISLREVPLDLSK